MKRSTNHLLAAVLAGLFGLLLSCGSLTSSDFFRGLYDPPYTEGYWDRFASLHANRVQHWNFWGYSSLGSYLNGAWAYGIKSVLCLSGPGYPTANYLLEKYSCGQYDHHEAEWDYDYAYQHLINDTLPEYYYHFWHGNSASEIRGAIDYANPENGDSWKCTKGAAYGTGVFLQGPCETIKGDSLGGYRSQTDWPDGSPNDRAFKSIFRVMADTSDLNSLSESVFRVQIRKWASGGSPMLKDTTFTGAAFADSAYPAWKNLEVNYIVPVSSPVNNEFAVRYTLTWYNHCDFWVDWIKYMDMERGYYLFYDNDTLINTLGLIADQCQNVETTYNQGQLAAWSQSDEPWRSSFRAHGIVNDMARDSLTYPPRTPLKQDYQRRPELFVLFGKPDLVETDPYVFQGTGSVGQQSELDLLADNLEDAYQACQIDQDSSIEMHFTGQVCKHWDSNSGSLKYRNPRRSEIFAETFMALAHGAKGISFYPYRSRIEADTIYGLVDENYNHDGEIYAEKWQAVQDVFMQLDSIGGTLDSLVRDTSFCVFPTNSGFKLPISNVYFTDDPQSQNYIEIGQFHRPPSNSPDYLILVNRRTNGDRHITVETNLPSDSTCALRDIYTQEQFISSTGDFKAIPFDSGEGRVFKLEPFNDWIWSNNDDHIVLADMVTNTTETPNEIWVNEGPARSTTPIYATKYGLLEFGEGQTLDCHGLSTDSAVFTALEPEEGWLGLKFDGSGSSAGRDSLVYTRVEHTSGPAIRAYDDSYLYLKNSWIKSASGVGIICAPSDLVMDSSWITNCSANGLALINSSAKIYNDSICYNGNIGYPGILAFSESVLKIGHSHLSFNDYTGIMCISAGTNAILLRGDGAYSQCGHNWIVNNEYSGVYAEDDAAIYLGSSSTKQGLNTIMDNTGYEVYNGNSDTLFAQYNYWGGRPDSSQFYGLVDFSRWLNGPPEDNFAGGSFLPPLNPSRGSDGLAPGGSALSEANRLNNVAVELFLDGEYYAAIDTFDLVVNQFPGTSPARFALNHLVVCYREAEDYEGAVAYLNSFLQPPTDPTLVPLALYHKVLNLARLQEYPAAIAIAGNAPLMLTMPQDLQEPLMIELGMMQKYGMQNVVVGNGVFEQFLQQFPESPLASIAAMELGIAWEPRGTSGSGAATGIGTVALPERFYLTQNHPNPFNPATAITFGLPVAAWVKVEVFDIAGRKCFGGGSTPALRNGWMPAGVHEVTFDGSDLASGIYLVRLQAGNFHAVKKMILLK